MNRVASRFFCCKNETSLNKIVFLASLLNMHPLEDIANTE
jgi:hypothetical protein